MVWAKVKRNHAGRKHMRHRVSPYAKRLARPPLSRGCTAARYLDSGNSQRGAPTGIARTREAAERYTLDNSHPMTRVHWPIETTKTCPCRRRRDCGIDSLHARCGRGCRPICSHAPKCDLPRVARGSTIRRPTCCPQHVRARQVSTASATRRRSTWLQEGHALTVTVA